MVEINTFGGLSAPPKKTRTCVSLSMGCVCFSLLFNFYLLLTLHPSLKPSRNSLVRSLRGKEGYVETRANQRRLAVVVPTYAADLAETLKSLEKWPTECTSDTKDHVDLVIYKAEPKDEESESETLEQIRKMAGTCFASTRMVYGDLTKEVRADHFHEDGRTYV